MNRCSFCEWIPILPLPVWPLAGQCRLGQNTVVGSMPCSSWLGVEACQEEYVGVPIFVTSELHHGSVQSYQMSALREYFRFLEGLGVISKSPTTGIGDTQTGEKRATGASLR